MRDLVGRVYDWATDRGLQRCDPEKQLVKLAEEFTELAIAHGNKDGQAIVDAVGDMQVVLIVYCLQNGIDFDRCLEIAYNEIKNRKGKIVNGIFVKDD